MIKVLIVDDEKAICDLIDLNLSASGYHCQTVQNGLDAIDLIENENFDLVLLDIMLPGADGFDVMDYIRPLQVPVIFITAKHEVRDRVKGLKLGADDYLVKPFEYARFQQALRHFADYRELMKDGCGLLGQKEIDLALRGRSPAGSEAAPMEKGLQAHTLDTIRQCMKADREHFFTSEEIAEQVHLSRVTVRRYMNHMLEAREIVSQVNYQTGGRPSIRYRYGNG